MLSMLRPRSNEFIFENFNPQFLTVQTGAQIESRDVRMTELLTIDREAIKQFQLLLFRELPCGLSAELAIN